MSINHELNASAQEAVATVKRQRPTEQQFEHAQARLLAGIEQYAEPAKPAATQGFWDQLSELFTRTTVTTKLAAAASFALACVVGISIITSGTMSSPAFAAVVKSLSQINTMSYSGVMQSNGQVTMQLDVQYRAPNQVRITTTPMLGDNSQPASISILDTDKGEGLLLMPAPKVAMAMRFDTQQNTDAVSQDPLYWMKTITQYEGHVTFLPQRRINDILVAGYEIIEAGMTITLWVDLDSQLPVRLHLAMAEQNGQVPFQLEADLQFNQPLDDKLFSLTPDSSYRMVNSD